MGYGLPQSSTGVGVNSNAIALAERYSLEMERVRSAAETLRQQAQQELAVLRVRVE